MVRIFVLSGWFGRALSPGMAFLAAALHRYGEVTVHGWRDPTIIGQINRHKGKVAVIGFSLGANQLGWYNDHVERRIELGVAYDPSKQSPLVTRTKEGGFVQHVEIYDRLVCYCHPKAWVYGGSWFEGPGVDIVYVNEPHLLMQFDIGLHKRTVEEVRIMVES